MEDAPHRKAGGESRMTLKGYNLKTTTILYTIMLTLRGGRFLL